MRLLDIFKEIKYTIPGDITIEYSTIPGKYKWLTPKYNVGGFICEKEEDYLVFTLASSIYDIEDKELIKIWEIYKHCKQNSIPFHIKRKNDDTLKLYIPWSHVIIKL